MLNNNLNSNEDGQNTSNQTADIQPQDEELQTAPVPVLHRLPVDLAAAPPLQPPEGSPAPLRPLPALPQLWAPHGPHHLPRPGRASPVLQSSQAGSVSLLEQ